LCKIIYKLNKKGEKIGKNFSLDRANFFKVEIPVITLRIETKFLLHSIGSGRDSLDLKGTERIVACRDIPSPVEFRSRPEGIRVDGRTFFRPRTVASRHRAALYRTHVRYSVDGIQPQRTWRAWKVKIASVNHYCTGVARHSAKVKQFAGSYIDVTFPFSLFLSFPFCFSSSSFARRRFLFIATDSRGHTCRQRPYPKTFDEVEQICRLARHVLSARLRRSPRST